MVNHFGSTSRTWSVPWMAANAGHRCSARFVAKTSCMVITYDSCHACTGMVHGVVATPLCPLKMMWIFFSKMVCPACTRWMNWLVVCTRHFLSTMKYIKMSSWVAKKRSIHLLPGTMWPASTGGWFTAGSLMWSGSIYMPGRKFGTNLDRKAKKNKITWHACISTFPEAVKLIHEHDEYPSVAFPTKTSSSVPFQDCPLKW